MGDVRSFVISTLECQFNGVLGFIKSIGSEELATHTSSKYFSPTHSVFVGKVDDETHGFALALFDCYGVSISFEMDFLALQFGVSLG